MFDSFVIVELFGEFNMAGVFGNAEKASKSETRKDAKKKNMWLVIKSAISTALTGFKKANEDAKAAQAKLKPFKETLEEFAVSKFIEECAENGQVPDLPVSIQTQTGEAVTFVVQNRAEKTAVTEEQRKKMGELVGDEVAAELITSEVVYSFNPFVLENKRCRTAVESLLTAVEKKLRDDGKLPADESIVLATTKYTFVKDILDKMVEVCGDDREKMGEFLDAVGPSVTMFVQNG